jgi:hypothetical protein
MLETRRVNVNGFRFPAAAALVLAIAVSTPGSAAAESSVQTRATTGGAPAAQVLVAPVLWLLGVVGIPVADAVPLPNSMRLQREQGWRDLECRVGDEGNGVYFEVQGRAEFERAVVRFGDGSERTLELGHAVRGSGLYLLDDFGRMAGVDTVVLRARARSSEAQVGVRLGR